MDARLFLSSFNGGFFPEAFHLKVNILNSYVQQEEQST